MTNGTTQAYVPKREDIRKHLGPRRYRRNWIVTCQSTAILAIFVSSALMVAPIAFESAVAAPTPITMTIGLTEAADTFNPFSMMSGTSWMVAWDMYEVLITRDPTTLEPMPMLAQSWDTSPDGKVWTFHLVESSVWHDDIPVTAEDVNWTFNLIISHPNECGLYQGYVKNITEVVALDDHTVRFTTDVPKATMLTMNVPILPKHLWSAVPLNKLGQVNMWDTKYFPNGPVGSGPMILSSYSKTLGDIWMLKWDKYHMDVINVDKVLYKVFTSEDAMMNSLFSGSIDVAIGVPISLWKTTIGTPGIQGQVADQLDMHHIGFNCAPQSVRDAFPKASKNTETTNTSVRQAVAMAINKTQIVTEILGGLADKGDTVIPPITPFWRYSVSEEEELKFDPEKARALLDAAGYRDTDGDNIRENVTSGVELSFGFYYPTGYDADALACQKISNWLKDIGINAPAKGISETLLFQYQYNMQYDMFSWSWWPEYDPSWILSVLTTDQIPDDSGDWAAWSDTFYSNPVYDQLWDQQQTAVNPTARQAIVHEMQRILYHDCPYIILWYPYALYAYRTDRFENFPDFKAQPGARPGDIFFFFQVTPIVGNQPPMFDAPLNPAYTSIVNTLQTFQVQVSDVDNEMLWVNWTFGDGSPVVPDIVPAGSSATPVTLTRSHTYTVLNPSPGYTMTVTLTDGRADHSKVSTATVYVIEKPDYVPTFTSVVSSSPPLEAHNDTVVTWFVNASDAESGGPNGFGLRFTWVWDDGEITVSNHQPTVNNTPVMDSVTHSWSIVGTYNVQVWVWDGSGLPGHNVSSGIISYQVRENTPPETPNISSISGTEGTWVNCVATSKDADADPLRITWEWDDGTYNVTNHAPDPGDQMASKVRHRWPVTGLTATYPVTVWVDDMTGYSGHNISATIDATIYPVGVNVPPTALLITPPSLPAYIDTNLIFNTSAIDTDGDALVFYFEFGDGASAMATLPAGVTTWQYVDFSHSYIAPSTYTVGLWVNDSTGPASHNSSTTATIEVTENEPPMVVLPSSLSAGYNKTFTVTPTQCLDNDGDPLQVWYDWGDGSPMTRGGDAASSYAASHVYSSLGNKTLTVYVDDGTGVYGHNVSASATVKVFEANLKPEVVGVIEKTPSKTSYLPNETITFTIVVRDFEGDNMTLTVEFGDGTQQEVTVLGMPTTPANSNITQNVTHAYATARTSPYLVNATIKDGMDHSDMRWSVGRASVQVTAPSPPPPHKEFPLALAVGISIAAVIVVVAILLLLKRKKKSVASTEEASLPPKPS